MPEESDFRTQDMALAAVLVAQGHTYSLERLSRTRAQWVFPADGKVVDLENIVAEYEAFKVRVEPRSFLEEVSRIRKELYKLLPSARKK